MAFNNAESRYFLEMLPDADGSFTKADCGLFLDIYYFGMPQTLAAQINMALTAEVTPMVTRGLSAEIAASVDASLAGWATRHLAAEIDIELTAYLTPGIDGDTGLIVRY